MDEYDNAVAAGHIVMMMFGPVRFDSLMPDPDGVPNRDWIPWDRERFKASLAEGIQVHVNVQVARGR